MRMHLAAVLAALLLAPMVSAARVLTGTGPAYWQEPARYPMHYPAAQAAVEGFVFNPMGGPSYCNARLVKPGVLCGGIHSQLPFSASSSCKAQQGSCKIQPQPETSDAPSAL